MTRKKKKLGRPELPAGAAKSVMLSARFSADEAAQISGAIKRSGQKKTAWIRNTLIAGARSA